jgi:hypothetical protein
LASRAAKNQARIGTPSSGRGDLQFRALFGRRESWTKLPCAQRKDRATTGPSQEKLRNPSASTRRTIFASNDSPAGVDVKRPLQIATANVTSGRASGRRPRRPSRPASFGSAMRATSTGGSVSLPRPRPRTASSTLPRCSASYWSGLRSQLTRSARVSIVGESEGRSVTAAGAGSLAPSRGSTTAAPLLWLRELERPQDLLPAHDQGGEDQGGAVVGGRCRSGLGQAAAPCDWRRWVARSCLIAFSMSSRWRSR